MFVITKESTRRLFSFHRNKFSIPNAFYSSFYNTESVNGLIHSKSIQPKRTSHINDNNNNNNNNNYNNNHDWNFQYKAFPSQKQQQLRHQHNDTSSMELPTNLGRYSRNLKHHNWNVLQPKRSLLLLHHDKSSYTIGRYWFSSTSNNNTNTNNGEKSKSKGTDMNKILTTRESLQEPAGPLYGNDVMFHDDNLHEGDGTTLVKPNTSKFFIPQIPLSEFDGRARKRVLVLCTGGTLTMAPNPLMEGALSPVQGAVTEYMKEMRELNCDNMPEVVTHEYHPFCDSSDLGPAEWAVLANDIWANYLHFDGFVILMGTDTMAYTASALSFMLENLGKPVVFTGSQIPLCEPYNDARRNLIMALIFASRDTINEVSIFFHDRLVRGCRATKINTHRLMAFDSPNLEPLAKIGISIEENEHLALPQVRGTLRVHSKMDTRLLTIRLVPGFDDAVLQHLIDSHTHGKNGLKTLVLQLYGTGNIPSVKDSLVKVLGDAVDKGILVIASTQCFTGSVMMGHYATGKALAEVGVISANDMTLEAISTKAAYLFGRGDLTRDEVAKLMGVSLRGEVTPSDALPPPTLSTAYQRASWKGKRYY